MTHWKSPWCWERSRSEEEGIIGWDSWTASPMPWTWMWANSGKWWGTGRPGVLQSTGLQRVRHDRVTEQQPQCKWRKTTGRDTPAHGLRALTTEAYWFQGTAQLQHYTPRNFFTPSLLPSFLFIKLNLFSIYFWPLWVFIAASGLSLVSESGGCSLAVMHGFLLAESRLCGCVGFSRWRLLGLAAS